MSTRNGVLLFLLLAVVFLALNSGAYQGYFRDDEIDALQWTRWAGSVEYLKAAATPIYYNSFRAVGFFYFHLLESVFGMDFPKYVAVLHAIHLLNIWLLWMVLRRLGFGAKAAGAGCVFFALHMALFDAVWKPMYVFDVLCGTFCLASLLLWMRGNWILSFVSFWLAYRAKELAVMLPLVLLCYELWLGNRRWARLAPFVAASLSFSVQALLLNPVVDADAYVFHFTPAALAATVPFYASRIFLVPYLGLLLPISQVARGNRRMWFGLAMMGLFFAPLVFLPGRVFSAYCYVPFTGLAVSLASLVESSNPAVVAAFFLLWMPLDLQWLRTQRNDTLRQDGEIREWAATVGRFTRSGPQVNGYVYRGMPEGFNAFGVSATVKYFLRRVDVTVPAADSAEGKELVRNGHTAVLCWDEAKKRLEIETP